MVGLLRRSDCWRSAPAFGRAHRRGAAWRVPRVGRLRRVGRGQREIPPRCARDGRVSRHRRLGLSDRAGRSRARRHHASAGTTQHDLAKGRRPRGRGTSGRGQRRYDFPRDRPGRRSQPPPDRALSDRRARSRRDAGRRAQQDRPVKRPRVAGGGHARAAAVCGRARHQRQAR